MFSFIERGIHGDVLLSTSFNIGTSNTILLAEIQVGTFIVRGIHGNVFLFCAYRVQRTKLNKNNFCVLRSRLAATQKIVHVKGHILRS